MLRIELKDTVSMMLSEDYKERMKAEYLQTKVRYERLHAYIIKTEAMTPDAEMKSRLYLLKKQKYSMGRYLHCLEVRAAQEGMDLPALVELAHAEEDAE